MHFASARTVLHRFAPFRAAFWVVFCVNKAVIGISVDTVHDLRNNRAWKDSKQLIYE